MGFVAPPYVGSSQSRGRTRVHCIGRQILNHWATREVKKLPFNIWGSCGPFSPRCALSVYIYIIGSQICLSFLASQLALKLLLGVVIYPTQRLLWVICGFSELYPVTLYVDTLLLPESQLPGRSCWCCILILQSTVKTWCDIPHPAGPFVPCTLPFSEQSPFG